MLKLVSRKYSLVPENLEGNSLDRYETISYLMSRE